MPLDLAGDNPCDITDTTALTDRLSGADAVIHLAAVADFADCDDDPERAQHVNAGEHARRAAVRPPRRRTSRRVRLDVLGLRRGDRTSGGRGHDAPRPRQVYTATKLAGELSATPRAPAWRWSSAGWGLPTVRARGPP